MIRYKIDILRTGKILKRIIYKGKELLPARRDLVFKALFAGDGDLELLASLLSSILELDIVAEDVIVTNSEMPAIYEAGKLSRLDIRAKLSDGEHINVEIQIRNEYNMEKRSLFHLSKLYIGQLSKGMDFEELGPAIAINILDFSYLPFEEFHNKYRMKNTKHNHELTEVFEINFIELPKVPKKNCANLKEQWMLFLSAETEEVLEMLVSESPVFEKAVSKLLYVSADEKLRYELDMREKAELDYNSGMITSYRRGKAEGIEEGKAEGELNKAYKSAMRALQRGAKPEDISYDLELPLDKVLELKEELNK